MASMRFTRLHSQSLFWIVCIASEGQCTPKHGSLGVYHKCCHVAVTAQAVLPSCTYWQSLFSHHDAFRSFWSKLKCSLLTSLAMNLKTWVCGSSIFRLQSPKMSSLLMGVSYTQQVLYLQMNFRAELQYLLTSVFFMLEQRALLHNSYFYS